MPNTALELNLMGMISVNIGCAGVHSNTTAKHVFPAKWAEHALMCFSVAKFVQADPAHSITYVASQVVSGVGKLVSLRSYLLGSVESNLPTSVLSTSLDVRIRNWCSKILHMWCDVIVGSSRAMVATSCFMAR